MSWHNPFRWIFIISPLLTSVFVSSIPATPRIPNASDAMTLSDQVREILSPDCGKCHNSSLPSAVPDAIKVFDFAKDNWPATITQKQLKGFALRTASLRDSVERKAVYDFLLMMKKPDSVDESLQ